MRFECLFLDNGGVITDNSQRAPQYRRLVGEFFVPRFGGSHDVWEASNMDAFQYAWSRHLARLASWDEKTGNVVEEMSRYYTDWLRKTFEGTGRAPPASDEECAALGRECDYWINPRVRCRFPGVEDVMAQLALSHRLFTASDGFGLPLANALGESAALFEQLYGVDLVNVPKPLGRPYYDAVFSHAGVDPATSLVVDDGVPNLLAAAEAGAHTVLVGHATAGAYDGHVIGRLVDLPALLETL
jgi:HAD superfamily hydrolase (TIGR01509 family)